MSGYQIFESTPEDEFAHTQAPGVNPPVIARLPDLDASQCIGESCHLSTPASRNARRLSVPKVAMVLTAAATVLFAGWIIFGDSHSSQQSAWQPTPPAASAPEAPLWNAKSDTKTASIKLDEIVPQWPKDAIASTDNKKSPGKSSDNSIVASADKKTLLVAAKPKSVTKPPTTDIRPRFAANRPLVIATPVPPSRPVAANRDWSTLSENEYYWAVRQRSAPTANARNPQHANKTAVNSRRPLHSHQNIAVHKAVAVSKPVYSTAKRPPSGYRDSDLATKHPQTVPANYQSPSPKSAPAARLNGVIETPNARMY